ncbi:hypothetical protein [Tamlana crocina]|uniref:Restriction endonuclease n=1 Tax=Tamlana crocina TaxID=393006 RepID=A0ABX1DI92_9FLAO|nr:hypothetical protein [Tamlana crocina]NJX16799.1 hypothetical protein [Tamlana crocina]
MNTKKVTINGFDLEVQKETADLFEHFSKFSNSVIKPEIFSELIVKVFNLTYLKDLGSYYNNEKIGRSSWTQHTANTFLRACQLVNLACDFEVENRHDGAVRDYDDNVYLCAEWEFDTRTIFNPTGEINKLAKTCDKYKNCDALLFTYSIDSSYTAFCENVFQLWNKQLKKTKKDFVLYLVTALMRKDELENKRFVYGLRTVVIGRQLIEIWEDEHL